jgi:hypothetical protein
VYKLCGVDVTQIPGLEYLALQMFSEIGRDMFRWAAAAHFVSWLALCPDHDITGGRVVWRGKRKAHNRAGQLFGMAAYALDRSPTPLWEDCLRRMKAKIGPPGRTHCHGAQDCRDLLHPGRTIWEEQDTRRELRQKIRLQRQAARPGYKLTPIQEAA